MKMITAPFGVAALVFSLAINTPSQKEGAPEVSPSRVSMGATSLQIEGIDGALFREHLGWSLAQVHAKYGCPLSVGGCSAGVVWRVQGSEKMILAVVFAGGRVVSASPVKAQEGDLGTNPRLTGRMLKTRQEILEMDGTPRSVVVASSGLVTWSFDKHSVVFQEGLVVFAKDR